MLLGLSPYTLLVLMCTNTARGTFCRVASRRFRVPTALTSKSSNGRDAARSWLGGRVHYKRRPKAFKGRMYCLTVANVDLMVVEAGMSGNEPLLVPARVTLRSKKISPHVIINAVDFPSALAKVVNHLGANKTGGTRHEQR